jgi:hypothetical protein
MHKKFIGNSGQCSASLFAVHILCNINPTLPRYGTDLSPLRSLFSGSGQYRNAVASGRAPHRVRTVTRSGGDISFYKIQE